MRYYLIVCLLASSVLINSCASSKKATLSPNAVSSPLSNINNTALYKAGIEVFGDFFSGLVLFKYNADKQDYNIVLLNEMGITLCEFYAKNNSVEVVSASSLFTSKMAQKTLAEDFSFMVKTPVVVKQFADKEYKSKDKIKYTVNANMLPLHMQKKRLVNGVMVDLIFNDEEMPKQVIFTHRGIKFKMTLKLLKTN